MKPVPASARKRSIWIASAVALVTLVAPGSIVAQAPQQVPSSPEQSSTTEASNNALSALSSPITNSPSSSLALHVTVGRSLFMNTVDRVKRIYIANPAVIDSYTADPHLVVITAKGPGTSSVILWDETGHMQPYQVSSDLDVEDLSASLKRALPVEDVQVHSRENLVILSGTVSTEAKSDAALKLAALYSKEVSNTLVVDRALIKQVNLKVRIVEIDRSKGNQFGFNFFSQGGNLITNTTTGQYSSSPTVNPGSGTTPTTLTVGDPLNFLLYSAKLNIGATLKDLASKQVLQILAEPNITTLSGEKANFLAGGEFPFPVVQGSSTGNTSITIQFRSYGVKVEFTPIVNADGTIELKVAPEVSALDFTNAVTISGYTIPALSTRRADTQVTLHSGESFAISGLLDKRTTDLYNATPGIANVPIIGQLFHSKNVTHSNSELIVIVTPEVIDPLNQTVPAVEPKPLIPFLAPEKFDKSLPKGADAMGVQ